MYKNFNEIEKNLHEQNVKKRIVLCGAHDEAALGALVEAKRRGLAEAILIGESNKIVDILNSLNEPIEDYSIIHEEWETKAAKKAINLIKEGKADIPMKGLVKTQSFLMAIIHPIKGIKKMDNFLSHAMLFRYPKKDRMLIATDTALTISPILEEKVKIINNAVQLAKKVGYSEVKVAALSAMEYVDPAAISSVEAKQLSEMKWDKDVYVEGPFALDNAIDSDAAKHKGIKGKVAGDADVILVPDFVVGNVFWKTARFFGDLEVGGVVLGAESPIILSSRSDDSETKLNSIITAILLSK